MFHENNNARESQWRWAILALIDNLNRAAISLQHRLFYSFTEIPLAYVDSNVFLSPEIPSSLCGFQPFFVPFLQIHSLEIAPLIVFPFPQEILLKYLRTNKILKISQKSYTWSGVSIRLDAILRAAWLSYQSFIRAKVLIPTSIKS